MKKNQTTKNNQKKVRRNVNEGFSLADATSLIRFDGYNPKLENKVFQACAEVITETQAAVEKKRNPNANAANGKYCPKDKVGFCWKNLPKEGNEASA